MEPKETQQRHSTTSTYSTPLPISRLQRSNASGGSQTYSRSAPSAALTSNSEPAKKKRGRPRKYDSLEQAMAARLLSSTDRREHHPQGNAGQGLTPQIINIAAGEDVSRRISMFLQQSNREMCILSASGTISYASLYQSGTSRTAYEGRFEIISLSGSYVRTKTGEMTGRLSVSLSTADGQVIGGGVGGPLMAAGPVQVIIGAFTVNNKMDINSGATSDAPGGKLQFQVGGTSAPNVGVCSGFEGNRQSSGGSNFMWQPRGTGLDFTGKRGHGAYQSSPSESEDSDL